MSADNHLPPSALEKSVILLVGMIQFVNILDFVMVMPLGPDLAAALNTPIAHIGYISGAYTFAASIAGLIAALYLDQISRRRATLFCLFGLSAATLGAAFVADTTQLIIMRLTAGAFGGPLTALAYALIADHVPVSRRGAATGKVMSAFSVASVIGVPFGLYLAMYYGFRAPFAVTGALGFAILALAYLKLPKDTRFSQGKNIWERAADLVRLLKIPEVAMIIGLISISMAANFMVIPNIAGHFTMNLMFPREHLGTLYLVGGVFSFFTVRMAGGMTDRIGSVKTVTIFSVFLAASLILGFILPALHVSPWLVFILFMIAGGGRNVSLQTVAGKIPDPSQRGAFMALNSAFTHLASSFGAYLSSEILYENHTKLMNVDIAGSVCLAVALTVPFATYYLESKISKKNPKKLTEIVQVL